MTVVSNSYGEGDTFLRFIRWRLLNNGVNIAAEYVVCFRFLNFLPNTIPVIVRKTNREQFIQNSLHPCLLFFGRE